MGVDEGVNYGTKSTLGKTMEKPNPPHPLVQRSPIRLAMLGCSSGNGHPYSWSAMFSGYDRERMTRECPFAGIRSREEGGREVEIGE
jgi:hypothetical protein